MGGLGHLGHAGLGGAAPTPARDADTGADDGAFSFADAQTLGEPYPDDAPYGGGTDHVGGAAPPPPSHEYQPFEPYTPEEPETHSFGRSGASLFGGGAQRAGQRDAGPEADAPGHDVPGAGAHDDSPYGSTFDSPYGTADDVGFAAAATTQAPPAAGRPGPTDEPVAKPWDSAWEASPWGATATAPSDAVAVRTPGPPPQPPKPEPKVSREVRLLAMAILIVLGLTTALYYYRQDSGSAPAAWDPRVAPVAAFVATDRGIGFRAPVAVHYLSPAEYDRKVLDEQPTTGRSHQQEAADAVAVLRAFGLVSGEVDAAKAALALAGPPQPAFYSFRSKAIFVRGTQVTVGTRVALARALTSVLQAQWTDYRGSDPTHLGGDPARTVAAGDVHRVEADYIARLSSADTEAYRQELAAAPAPDPAVPEALTVLGSAPELFGKRWVRAVGLVQGQGAVNRALQLAPTSDQQVFDPYAFLAASRPLQISAPVPPQGAEVVADGELGSTLLYELLADRVRPFEALSAADGWAGDQYVAYRTKGTVCVDVHFRGANDAGAAAIQVALGQWATTMPTDLVKVTNAGNEVAFHSCDPGASGGVTPGNRAAAVLTVPLTRSDIASDLYEKGLRTPNGPNGPIYSAAEVRCVGDVVIRQLTLDEISNHPAGSAKVKGLVAKALPGCRTTVSGSDTGD